MNFNSTELATLVKEAFEPTWVQAFERNSAFYRLIEGGGQKRTVVEKDLTWKVQVAGTLGAGSYSEDGSVGITRQDLGPRFTTARLGWRLNKVPISVTGLAQAISSSPSSIVDALALNTRDALAELQKNMNRQMLSDGYGALNGVDTSLNAFGLDLTGVQAMIDDGASVPVYAGIDRAVNPFWRSYVLRNSAAVNRPITEELIFQVMNEMQGVREVVLTDAWCSLGVQTQFGLLMALDRRFNFGGGELPAYTGGFDANTLRFQNMKITGLALYERNRMDFLNLQDVTYNTLLDIKMEGRDSGDLDAYKLFAKVYSQLKLANPFASASIRHLAE